jgi:hypothetical protein
MKELRRLAIAVSKKRYKKNLPMIENDFISCCAAPWVLGFKSKCKNVLIIVIPTNPKITALK